MSRPISDHIRSNVWGIAACFILLTGTAFAASNTGGDPVAAKSASLKAQVKKLKKRVAALEGAPGDVSPRPPTGPAGGALTGSYPNPVIGPDAVGGAEVANGTLTGSDVATDSLSGLDINEGSLGTGFTSLPVTVGGLTLSAAQFTSCTGGGNIRVRFDAHTDNDNTRVAIAVLDSAVGPPAFNISEDFDAVDTALVETNDGIGAITGRVTVEYRDPLVFGAVDLVSVELFFTAVNSGGSCSVTELLGRAIG